MSSSGHDTSASPCRLPVTRPMADAALCRDVISDFKAFASLTTHESHALLLCFASICKDFAISILVTSPKSLVGIIQTTFSESRCGLLLLTICLKTAQGSCQAEWLAERAVCHQRHSQRTARKAERPSAGARGFEAAQAMNPHAICSRHSTFKVVLADLRAQGR